jgi:uracil-DNA glycosylase
MITCTLCDICSNNNHIPVLGDGSKTAAIIFIGRNPSYQEKKHGIPQMNKAGMLFQRYLNMFNISRDDIYITDSVKCKTPNDRHPNDCEITNCHSKLEEELLTINPKIIVLLGTTALRSYFNLVGTNIPIDIRTLQGKHIIHKNRIIIFSYHPSYIYKYEKSRLDMYKVFVKLTHFIRVYKPWHTTNIGI